VKRLFLPFFLLCGIAAAQPPAAVPTGLSGPNYQTAVNAWFTYLNANKQATITGAPGSWPASFFSLNGLTGGTQTFTNDTNITIVSGGTEHVLTWVGALAKGRQHAATIYSDQANAYGAGFKQTFTSNSTTAAVNFAPYAGDPSSLFDGDHWYNSATGLFKARIASSTKTFLFTDGNAATATALAANGTNCSAGSYPLGVDASGNAEGCTVAGGGGGNGVTPCVPVSASGTTFTCAPGTALASYANGTTLYFIPDVACTGGATTVNVSSLGAKSIKMSDGSTNPLAGNCAASTPVTLTYDGTVFRLPFVQPYSSLDSSCTSNPGAIINCTMAYTKYSGQSATSYGSAIASIAEPVDPRTAIINVTTPFTTNLTTITALTLSLGTASNSTAYTQQFQVGFPVTSGSGCSAGTLTIVSATPISNYASITSVAVSNVTPSNYNATYTPSWSNNTTFTVAGTSCSGSYTSGGMIGITGFVSGGATQPGAMSGSTTLDLYMSVVNAAPGNLTGITAGSAKAYFGGVSLQ
jgi:hypothetical protein